jgi:glycosidase
VFHHYRQLIALRKQEPLLVHGRTEMLLPEHPHVVAYMRTIDSDSARLLVLCNFSAEPQTVVWDGALKFETAELLLGNYPTDNAELAQRLQSPTLRPFEALLVKLRPH